MFGALKLGKLDVTVNCALHATHVTSVTLFPASTTEFYEVMCFSIQRLLGFFKNAKIDYKCH